MTPEASRIAVFSRGTSSGLRGWIPVGGQCPPSSGVGTRLEWKNAQKKPRKKKASDVMNKIIPYRRPFWTGGVWWPWNVLSRTMSRHHWIIIKIMESRPRLKSCRELWWNHMINPEVVSRAAAAPKMGQGLGSTMW